MKNPSFVKSDSLVTREYKFIDRSATQLLEEGRRGGRIGQRQIQGKYKYLYK